MNKTLLFSLSLYREDAVQAAVDAYSQLADFRIERLDSACRVEINCRNKQIMLQLKDAFCNHVLFETIIRHRNSSGAEL